MKRSVAVLVVGSLSVGHGFSSWNSINRKPPLVEDQAKEESTRKPPSTFAQDATKSAMAAFVANTLTAGSFLAPLPAIAQDWNAAPMVIEKGGAPSLQLKMASSRPPSVISSASLILANDDHHEDDDHSHHGPTAIAEAHEDHHDDEHVIAEAHEDHHEDAGQVVIAEAHEEEMLAGSAKERAKADPPGETYLLVQADEKVAEEATELAKEVEVISTEEQTLLASADNHGSAAEEVSPSKELVAEVTVEESHHEETLVAVAVESQDSQEEHTDQLVASAATSEVADPEDEGSTTLLAINEEIMPAHEESNNEEALSHHENHDSSKAEVIEEHHDHE